MLQPFDYSADFAHIDFREHPELYRIGRGEQGVLLVEPYKSEILPHWRFKSPEIAERSSAKILRMFRAYLKSNDFVGADMARKFLQMGWTRARRYANHASGRKYDGKTRELRPREENAAKAKSAQIFYDRYVEARQNGLYRQLKRQHVERYP
jgi:hypothetical protein